MTSTVGRAALVVSGGILLSRLLGFARNVLLFALLGADEATDLYVAAFTIPDYLFFLMAGGYLSITLVPILARPIADGDEAEARRSFTAVFRVVGILLVAATSLLLVTAGPLTRLLFPGFEDPSRLAGLARIALASQVFFGAGALLMAAQYARKRFVLPMLAPLVYNLGIITGGSLGAVLGEPSPEAFLWGGLAGAALGNFGLQWWGARREGIRLEPGTPWRHPALARYLALALPLMIGQSVVALDEQWPRLFGQFAGEGGVAALYGARQLNMLPVGVIAQAAGVAAYPFLASLFAERRMEEMHATVTRSLQAALAFAGLATAMVVALAPAVVRLAYQRGAFGAADTEAMAPLLAVYALSIPFWAAHQVSTRALYAMGRMWVPVGIGTAITALTVPALFLAVAWGGALGVAAVSSASVASYSLLVGLAWRRQAGRPIGLSGTSARVAVRAAAASAVAALVSAFLPEGSPGQAALALAVAGGGAAAVYVLVGRLLGSPPVESLLLTPRRSTRAGPASPPAGGR